MRRVDDAGRARRRRWRTAMREAESAFGDATVFLERAVIDPRHIEVQILADHGRRRQPGGTIHLFERDCSVQRRHQKVIEVAPAVGLDPGSCGTGSAPTPWRSPGTSATSTPAPSSSCSTSRRAAHVFIEMNPRIQVEHTVTEEITDVDLVASQIRIAAGETLDDLGLRAGRDPRSGAPRCSAGSPPRTRPTASGRTPAGSSPTARPAAPASGSTAAPCTPAPRSAPTSTRCWSS